MRDDAKFFAQLKICQKFAWEGRKYVNEKNKREAGFVVKRENKEHENWILWKIRSQVKPINYACDNTNIFCIFFYLSREETKRRKGLCGETHPKIYLFMLFICFSKQIQNLSDTVLCLLI